MATRKPKETVVEDKPVRRRTIKKDIPLEVNTPVESTEAESVVSPEEKPVKRAPNQKKPRSKATAVPPSVPQVTDSEIVNPAEENLGAIEQSVLEPDLEPAEDTQLPEAEPLNDAPVDGLNEADLEEEVDQLDQDASDQEPVLQKERNPQVLGLQLKSLWNVIKGLFAPKPKIVPEEIESVSQQLSPEELERRVAENTRELEIAQARVREIQAINQEKQLLAESLGTRVDEIQEFISKVERSYFWRVQKRMESDLALAKSDLEQFEEAVKDVKTPETGRLIDLRKAFHKSVAVSGLITGVVAAFTFFYPIVAYMQAPEWAQTIFESDAFSSLLVALVVAAYGLIYLIRRFAGEDKFPVNRIVIFTVIIAILVALFVMWPDYGPEFVATVIPFLTMFLWQILSASASVFTLALIVSLLVYYRGWSIFRRDVTELLTKLSNVIEGYVKTQQEVSRLGNLYKQTSDWLEILAHSLYRPWKTHPDWEGTREFENHYSTFPFALRVAQAKEERDSRMAELERLVGGRLLVQGWRADAFDDMVDNAGLEMGLQEGKFTTEVLDADLPHQTNNSRALLLRFLKNSAKSQMAGKLDLETTAVDENGVTTIKPSDKYLVEVAKVRLLDLIDKTQSIVLSEARPRVLHIQDDPLEELREDQGGIEDYDPTHSWDEFLKESLGTDEVAQPPMGILNFSEKGRISRVQEDPASFIITPKRLFGSLPPTRSEKIVIVPVGDEKSRAVEIIARVDVVGPIAFDQIALLSGASASEAEKLTSSWDDNEVL
jgi:hypothetical protein